MKKYIYTLLLISLISSLFAQKINLERIEPPNWWAGMKNSHLQLLLHGENISLANIEISSERAKLKSVTKVKNPNYLFLDIDISPDTTHGSFNIIFEKDGKEIGCYNYILESKKIRKRGFSSADVIYLLMPDRFANGNPDNDNMPGMSEKADRNNPDGRHGGDIKGISEHLDYIKDLGMTALWINPLVENNNPKYSYHGYGMTDFYKTDPRFGTNQDYLNLAHDIHKKDMKLIMDMVFNHIGESHWWIKDVPMPDWFNHDKNFKTSYRAATVADTHASDYDLEQMTAGWFVETMPDLNQHNPFLAKYLIQNSIWWVETADLDGIRMDTQAYPYKDFMAEWALQIKAEYPDLTLLGETWLPYIAYTAYFSRNSPVSGNYNSHLDCVTDFPLRYAFEDAFNEDNGWKTGLAKFYYTFGRDFLYGNAYNNVTFLDNHDVTRFFSSVKEDVRAQKMGIAILLTARGIPMFYYGTEILFSGLEHDGHGQIRKDFPGGWKDDKINAFTGKGLSKSEKETLDYTKKIALWRQNNKAVAEGKFMHFVPENDVYVYFRYTDNEAVMVLVNNHKSENRTINGTRFNEILKDYSSGLEITSGKNIPNLTEFNIPAKTVLIIELKK